jgi:hypothetical protein
MENAGHQLDRLMGWFNSVSVGAASIDSTDIQCSSLFSDLRLLWPSPACFLPSEFRL